MLLLNAALPPLALLLLATGRGLYSLEQKRSDPRPSMAIPLIIPGMALGLRALTDVNLLDPWQALGPAVLGALVMTGVAVSSDPQARARPWIALLFLPLLAAYPAGLAVTANAAFDRAPPEIHQQEVGAKHMTSGKTTSYYVDLLPSADQPERRDVEVGSDVYERVEKGDRVQVVQRPGRLGMPWFYVSP
jgi:hypothetical protein